MIKSLLLAGIIMLIVPLIIGLFLLRKDNEKNNCILALLVGFIIEIFSYQVLAMPFLLFHRTFKELSYCWISIIVVIFLISIIVLIKEKRYKEFVKYVKEKLTSVAKFPTIVLLLLILFQCYYGFFYMHIDEDDSNFVAKAVVARQTNTLFAYDDQGREYEVYPWRQFLSQFPHYTATISMFCDIHPTIMAHTIFPVLFLIYTYAVLFLVFSSLFKGEDRFIKIPWAMLLIGTMFLMGNYSRYAVPVRVLTRVWQGKNILAGIIMPFILYLYLDKIGKDNNKIYIIILFMTLWGSILLSTMSITLPLIEVCIMGGILLVKEKKLKYIPYTILFAIPGIIHGIIYYFAI